MRKALATLFVSIAVGAVRSAGAQSATPPKPPFGTEIATSDSLYLGDVTASPDGRWLLFASPVRSGPSHLWVIPANGGAPHRLTNGVHDEVSPRWFPSGRRIAFTSSNVHGVMTCDFDPVGGRLVGTPKRASLEEGSFVDVAPDGTRIVYIDERNRLRLIPANGGPATTVLDQSGAGRPALGFSRFSSDGREVYVTTRDRERKKPGTLLRVPVSGGPATIVMTAKNDGPAWNVIADPPHDRVLVYTQGQVSILTLRGDTIAVTPPLRGALWVNHTPDGRKLLKTTAIVNAVVRLVPTAGGKAIDATPGRGYDYPVSWSADGTRLYSMISDTTITHGKFGLLTTVMHGGDRRFIPFDSSLSSRPWREAATLGDGRYWALIERRPEPPYPLVLYDVQTHQAHEITRNALRLAVSPGGYTAVGDELLYVEQQGTVHQLRALRANGESRLLHTFSHLSAPWQVAVHGNRIAYPERVGDSTMLRATRYGGTEQLLTAVAGDVTRLAWSPDGRMIGAIVEPSRSSPDASYSVMFIEVTDQSGMRAAPRIVHTDAAWDLYWMPDGRAVSVLEEQGATDHTRVLRVSVDGSQQPISLTPNERHTFWDQFPSPDGRYVAIPVEQFGASTLWSIDVDSATKAWREKRSQASARPGAQ